jgi:hypothetical protein
MLCSYIYILHFTNDDRCRNMPAARILRACIVTNSCLNIGVHIYVHLHLSKKNKNMLQVNTMDIAEIC